MTRFAITRRRFSCDSLVSLLAAAATTSVPESAFAQPPTLLAIYIAPKGATPADLMKPM